MIYGRSDSTINRGGIRMGTSEIYRAVLALDEIVDALVVDVPQDGEENWMPLFVVLREGAELDDDLVAAVRKRIREDCSPRHVPSEVRAIAEVPRTLSGKVLEVPVKRILMGEAPERAASRESLANPKALDPFVELARERALERRRERAGERLGRGGPGASISAAARPARRAAPASPAASAAARHWRWRLRTGPVADDQQRGPARRASRSRRRWARRASGAPSSSPAATPGGGSRHERGVGGDGRVDRAASSAPSPRRRDAPRPTRPRRPRAARRSATSWTAPSSVPSSPATRAAHAATTSSAASDEPPQAAAARRASRCAQPRRGDVGARREQQVDAPARRRPGEHDLRRAAREQQPQRATARCAASSARQAAPTAGRHEPRDRRARARRARRPRPAPPRAPIPTACCGRTSASRPTPRARRRAARRGTHREPPLGIAAHGAGRHRGER